jgi:ABC-2 type transport system permease protein
MKPGLFNAYGVWAIYKFEISRFWRTAWQSLIAPVLTTTLYFVVFGAAIGARIQKMDGIDYGTFIVPGLIMMTLLMQSISNGSFGIYFPKFTGTVYEILSAPISYSEIVLAYVGASTTKSVILGLIMLGTASFFVDLNIMHPVWMIAFLVLISATFSLFGFILGIWAKNFEQLAMVPMLIITPLTFLGGAFYSIDMLPGVWRTVTLFNPVVYLISGFRWSFYGTADVSVEVSLGMTLAFFGVCMSITGWIFKSGYRLKP